MRYKVGDRVRATRFSSYEGDTGTVHNIDEAVCDNAVAVLWDDNGWCHYDTDDVRIEPLPTEEQEKPVGQVYEVGGTLTLSEAIEAAKRGEIVESVTQGGKVHWHDKCLRWTTQNEPVSCSEANLTGWRVVPKPVPMTRELQEALEALLAAKLVSGPLATDTAFGRLALSACDFYQKAKEAAK